jgi:hypothetical protein
MGYQPWYPKTVIPSNFGLAARGATAAAETKGPKALQMTAESVRRCMIALDPRSPNEVDTNEYLKTPANDFIYITSDSSSLGPYAY